MFTHILVPTDGSPLSEKAVHAAVCIAKENDAKITFLNVQPEYTFPVMIDLPVSFDISQTEYQASAMRRANEILDHARREAEYFVELMAHVYDGNRERVAQRLQVLDAPEELGRREAAEGREVGHDLVVLVR